MQVPGEDRFTGSASVVVTGEAMEKSPHLEGALRPHGPEGIVPSDPTEATYARQRRYPRIHCFIAVQLRPESDHGLILGNLSDVSLGGCGVESANHLASETLVALCPLTAEGEVWVRGVVVNSRFSEGTGSFHLGVRFLEEPSSTGQKNVAQFVRFAEQAAAKQNPGDPYLRKLWGL